MTEALLTSLSMENHGHSHGHGHGHGHMGAPPSTLLSMDSSSAAAAAEEAAAPPQHGHNHGHGHGHHSHNPPDINLPLSVAEICAPASWTSEPCCDILDVSLGSQIHDTDALLNLSKSTAATAAVNNNINPSAARKCARRGDSIWGAWFFFNFYFKPALTDKAKSKLGASPGVGGGAAFDKADLRLDLFLVQHDMENMYMWVFKERPENALGKMQLRSFMNGHSRLGEPQFPFSVDKGFVRSHRMQRKHYRGLSNPQCVHGIEVVRLPNLGHVIEGDLKKWMELTGRDLNFSIPHDAEAFTAWRNLPSTDFELERPPPPPMLKPHNPNGTINNHNNLNSSNVTNNNTNSSGNLNCSTSGSATKRLLNGAGLNLSTQLVGICSDSIEPSLSPTICCSKRRKEYSPMGTDEECCLQHYPDRIQDMDMIHQVDPVWANDFTGVMRQACGPVTAAKTIYEDEKGYLILVSLPFTDSQRVRVSWRNTVTHGIVKVHCISTARTPYIKRGDRTYKLTDPSPEHCPPGEFIREIALATRIPENAELQAYYVEAGAGLEIMVPKHHVLSEEHEVRVFLRPQLGPNELLLT